MERLTMDIAGMSCEHCVRAVTNALGQLDSVQVENVAVGSATVAYDPTATSPEQITQAIEDAGYEAYPASRGAGQA
ncbi:MAG: heavy-metal-associated domain-containing protein [Gemmatimonadaceae bacterium]